MHLPVLVPGLNRIRRALGAGVLVAALGFTGTPAAASPISGRFAQLRQQDLRVASVAYRLAIANRLLCAAEQTPQLGFVLHGLGQYGEADRAEAARSFGLGRGAGVMAVVAGSPADIAGLQTGDSILAVNGSVIGDAGDGRAAIDRAEQALVAAMRGGAVNLLVARGDATRDIRFTADNGCGANVELIVGDAVNAWADGSRVLIGGGLLRQTTNDNDLALVIAHEMSHNLLHHRQRLAGEGVARNGLLPLTAGQSLAMRATEEEADRLAVQLAAAAGYDLSGGEAFIAGLMGNAAVQGNTHPALPRRLALLRAAIAGSDDR